MRENQLALRARQTTLSTRRESRSERALARLEAVRQSPAARFLSLIGQDMDVDPDRAAYRPFLNVMNAVMAHDLMGVATAGLGLLGMVGGVLGRTRPNASSEDVMSMLEDGEGQRAWLRHVQCELIPAALGEPPIRWPAEADTASSAGLLTDGSGSVVDGEVIRCG